MLKWQEETVNVKVFTPHVVSRAKEGMTGGTMARDQLKGKHQVFTAQAAYRWAQNLKMARENLP